MKKPKPLSQCDACFHAWVSRAYSKLPEGQDFPADDEFMYEVWLAAWRSAYSAGIMRGQQQGRQQVEYFNYCARRPMSYSQMEDLFEGCKNGREYGLKIERWHGIFQTEEDKALEAWHIKQLGQKV